ncbi:MAG: helix-turn-helix domain containing protein [Deltaproteobacteria bacterium]|jgi:hypothetical protein|nr:helix-turn-helix domain containing protein [Deltaproteobacteria bacterium]
MKNFNLKQISPETQLAMKKQFINNFKNGKMQVAAIAAVLMLAVSTVYGWAHIYLLYGKDALLARHKPGPDSGGASQEKNGRLLNVDRHVIVYQNGSH